LFEAHAIILDHEAPMSFTYPCSPAGTTQEMWSLTDGIFGVAEDTSLRLLAAPLIRLLYYLTILVVTVMTSIKRSPMYAGGVM
jgi:hypothetical protein